MSNTPIQEPPAQELSSSSGQTLLSRPFQPISDPSASKRVCFYKSGDYKFSGHRMVINARTFKTFDALLDALSKKVPLPFGVRTITTPRGIHLVRALDDLHDGGSYVCSDQKRVKPLNLDEVNRRQVPWNTTRPFSAGRRKRQGLRIGQFGIRSEATNGPAKVPERVAVRTPKRLEVIKNRDPTVKRTIVLQRKTAPTFDALLDYLSQILQFPVLKLFSIDGRRVDGLAALILCSGVVVAAGNEPFRLGNYSFHRVGQMAQAMYMDTVEPSMLQPRAQNDKSFSSGRGSRNFSLSSERYIVNQINKSQHRNMNDHLHHHNGSFEAEVNHHHSSLETCGTGVGDNGHQTCIAPQDDDIEKSFRVNQDGSMTVEMKVRLTIKEEEMLHWTTTLSRSSLSKRPVCASISESGNSSPDTNNAIAKNSSSISEDETKEENHPAEAGKGVCFNDQRVDEGYTSTALRKSGLKRTPTPGPRHVKRASVESVKTVTESGVQESTLGHYSYMERTAEGETTEGYCVMRHSSSSNRPIPKPRKTVSAEAHNKDSHSSIRSSGVAEVLQMQNNGMEVTETVMHIYETQGCYDNYFANEDYSVDSVPLHGSTPSSSNDCDIDFSRQPPTTDSLHRQTEEMLSLSSEPITPTREITNNLSSVTEHEAQSLTISQIEERVEKDKTPKGEKKKKMIKPARNQNISTSTSSSDKKQKETIVSSSKNSKHSTADKLSSVEKKSFSSSESAKSGQKSRGVENPQFKKDENTSRTEQALLVNTENVKRTLPKRQNINKASAKDNNHNINTPTGRPQMKNMVDILRPKKILLPSKKTASKPKSMIENRMSSPKKALELTESFSMPSVNPSPSEIHQYVENWLEKVNPDPVPYTEEAITDESESRTKVVFQIGGDSESDEKSKCQTNLNDYYPSPGDAVKKSSTCLSIPLCQEQPAAGLLHNEQYVRGLCVSMPSVRVDPVHQEDRLRSHKSIEAIGPADNESSWSTSNILSPRAKIKPVLRQLCSSIHCIRGTSDTNITSNIEKSNSLPDFQTQVASVFGSSCKAFLSFLSVMTLRDNITGSVPGDGKQSRSSSEAMLMMESLQKISAIDDEEEQRASLTDLQSRASSQFRERWKDFQTLRERLESEPLSPKVSETEFALDVVSEGGEVFDDQQLVIDELMEELNMPQDLRAQISSTIQQVKSFYPVEESTFVETERNQSDSEQDVETFAEECNDETKSPEPDATTMMTESDREHHEVQERGINVKESEISQRERDEPLTDNENENEKEEEEQVEEVEEDWEGMYHREDGDTKKIHDDDDDDDEETKKEEREVEAEEMPVTKEKMDDEGQEEWEDERGSGEGKILKGEKEEDEETEERLMAVEDEEPREGDSVEETDERDCVEETEEEEKEEDGIDEETDKEEKEEEEGTEEKQGEEMEDEEDEVVEEKNEGEEVANMIEEVEEEKQEETDAVTEKDIEEGVIVKQDEEEETDEGIEEGDEEANTQIQKRVKKDKTNKSEKKKKMIKPTRNQEGSTSTSSSDKNQKESISSSKNSKHSSTDRLSSNTSVGKKSLSSPESAKSGQKSRGVENPQFKKVIKDENTSRTEQALLGNTKNVKRTLPKRQNMNKASAKDNSHNVNTTTGRPQMKNTLDILRPKKILLPSKKTASKPKSMIENRMSSPKKALELTESFSMPSVNPSPSEIHQYVENWLEKVNPDPVPYTEEAITDESEPQTKVVFQIGGDSESDEKSKCQTNLNDYYPSPGDAVKKSSTCLSIPLFQEQPAAGLLHNEQYVRGLCVSMPSVRVDPVHQEDRLRSHKSIEAIGPADNESSLSASNILSPRAKIKPVLRQLCSSIHCIRGTSDTNITSNIEKSNSLPDFQTQVASVFGSSCKAFLSFLSVMTLRDNITGSVPGDGNQSRSSSEAMLMMESLQKISAIDDKEEQRASLTDLQSRASSQFRERWKDFQTLRERLESEPLSPKVSETEFALDVVSEGGEVFDDQQLVIDELMEELNMPQDLRAQISSTIQQVKSFYPVEESTFVETERNQSDSEEDVETFAEECNDETKQSPEPDATTMMTESDREHHEVQERGINVKESEISQTDKDEPLTDNENEKEEEEQVEAVENNWVGVNHREDGDTKEIDDDDDGEETVKGEMEEEAEEVPVTEEDMDDEGQEEWEDGGSEEVNILKGEKEEVEETEEGSMDEEDEEPREGDSVEETDERVCVEETEEEEKEEDEVDEETDKKEKEEEDDDKTEVGEENNEEEEEGEQEEEHEERDGVVVGVTTDDTEEGDETDKIIEEKEKCGESEESWEVLEKTENGLEEESVEEVVEEIQIKENVKAGQMLDEEESEDDEENESHEGLDQVEEQKSNDELEEESVTNDADSKHLLEEASYLGQQSNCEEELNVGTNVAEHKTESSKCSSEGQCEDDKGNGTDSVNELETVDGGQHHEDTSRSLPHPVEISQELLDFVNSALQSSSLIFTYDTQGNMRIEPDNARVVQTKQTVIPKSRNDSSYGLKRLPSPSTSDLSDYRPETSESDGYKTQESVDIVTESGEEASGRPSPAHSTDIPNGRTNEERANSKLQNCRLKSGGTSCDSGAKASREDLSYFSAASSQKADGEAPLEATQCISFSSEKDSTDGVLIDQGRWLLKENHLIRRSPPVSLGMYDNVDSTPIDTGEENTSVDSPSHYKSQYNPLAAISSSELEEMAKPQTPKCTYYNMPHGSDSDPFLDDSSVKSGKKDSAVVKGKGFRVSPTIDTSKTSTNKNGSLSSFASVEFKIPDRKVHPEGESSAVTQAGRTSSGGGTELQAQDSLDTLQVRCGQYCPIL